MSTILIADDEKIERDGIKFLIKKFGFELNIVEAENGKKALEFIRNNPVDILFTDIKMPFMDGLELSEKARILNPNLKIIICSAFGEFEYAKKAINIKVEHYILKPIKKAELFQIFTEVVEICKKEEINKEKAKREQEIYKMGIQYEKEKVFLNLLSGAEFDEQHSERIAAAGLDFSAKFIQMAMIDFRSKFYDLNNEKFIKMLDEKLKYQYEYFNLNERQSIIFILNGERELSRDTLFSIAEDLKTLVNEKYNIPVTIVFSDVIRTPNGIYSEFNNIEQVLDCKFFHEEGIVLFTHAEYSKEPQMHEVMEKTVDKIYKSIELNDYLNMDMEIEKFFENLKGRGSFSVIYVKYVCAEIIKRILKKTNDRKYDYFNENLQKLFNSVTLAQLKESLDSVKLGININNKLENDDSNKKVIKDIKNIVEDNYMKDISVEWIAEKVYLSPNYLSFIFKKETGQSLGKYITNYRLKVSEELLQNTNMKIVDICDKIGYVNTSYFCLTFKNYYGLSPMKYREKDE